MSDPHALTLRALRDRIDAVLRERPATADAPVLVRLHGAGRQREQRGTVRYVPSSFLVLEGTDYVTLEGPRADREERRRQRALEAEGWGVDR